jgi:lipocalin
MGNSDVKGFSDITQSDFDTVKYGGMWYQTYDSTGAHKCDQVIAFHVPRNDIIYITTYCMKGPVPVSIKNSTAVAPNIQYAPGKLVLRTEGSFGTTPYWVYYTDYTNYAIVGSGKPSASGVGSDFVVLSRKETLTKQFEDEIAKKVRMLGLVGRQLGEGSS